MKKKKVFSLAMALFLAIGLVIGTGVMAAEKATQETIQGMVEPGNKGTAVVKTDDGHTFKILGQNMAAMIGKKVKVTGTLSKDGNAARSIIVTSFEEVQD
jgi:hypothetical protein